MSTVEYRPGTALVVVDVQNDFADPKGSLYVQGGEDVVPIINREIDRARRFQKAFSLLAYRSPLADEA